MAKNEKKESTALATSTGAGLATTSRDELADVLDEGDSLAVTGLEEIDGGDIKIAAKVANFKGTDNAGDPIPANVWYDTITEETKKELDVVFLDLHKTNEWRHFDNATQKSVVDCRSFDRVNGVMADGTERKCEGCPDAQWKTIDGKRTRNCGTVFNMLAIDRATSTPCMIRFKRTALPVLQTYLNKHHLGRRIVKGKPSDYPLYVFALKAALEMKKGGASPYAVPVLERGAVLTRDEIMIHAESIKFYRDRIRPILERAADQDIDDDNAKPDASFDKDDFIDTTTEVEAPPANAKRF